MPAFEFLSDFFRISDFHDAGRARNPARPFVFTTGSLSPCRLIDADFPRFDPLRLRQRQA